MKKAYLKIIKVLGKKRIVLDEPLAAHTTFRIGGPADLYYEAKINRELVKAIKKARENNVPYFILGGGSNLLVADKGFRGMVIKVQSSTLRLRSGRDLRLCSWQEFPAKGGSASGGKVQRETILAETGTPTALVLHRAMENDLTGLEFLSGVPGTIGGAVVCNARAHFLGNFLKQPKCLGEILLRLEILTPEGKIKTVPGKTYVHTLSSSRIKKTGDIILSVELKLKKGVTPAARQYLRDYEEFRRGQPYQHYPTPGSIFQNPSCQSAGRLIDQCGLKGEKAGQAQISPKHGNFIVNLGGAKAADVLQLINLCKQKVFLKFKIKLKEEIMLVGEF